MGRCGRRSFRRTCASFAWALPRSRGVPAFVIFGDATLREMARRRPGTRALAEIPGVGQAQVSGFGGSIRSAHPRSLGEVHGLTLDEVPSGSAPLPSKKVSGSRLAAYELFRKGASIETVMQSLGRAHGTTSQYLAEFIMQTSPASIEAWVDAATYARVAEAVRIVARAT